ncbi:NAD(P)H-binding protein [Mycobacterium sp. 663a-19]|uniref:NAD(P)H-binding protein n=1 Tax=Mycobacterium sp. 663a-19 TaxID=2986148 RepID=UPI002D1ECDB5|nr:NAD(P)H-binding protein [Mycobacterium sp. 663a-19]MEB3981295.1 NAD(P)H-binding protein [Mycobacterium sp. 663a-19]
MRVLVTGATGYVGSRLVTALLADRHQVVAASRNPARLNRFGWFDDVAAVRMDACDPASARAALDAAGRVDVIYYLVHAIGQRDFRDADRAAAHNVATAARDAGVRRIVYLGGFVPDGEISEHLASRAEVADALTVEGGPELVWLGAAMIIGAGSTSFEMMRYVGDRFPLMPIPDWMTNPIDPISIRDALHYLVAAADPERVPAGGYDIAGPDTTSYRELLQTYARISGRWHAAVPVGGVVDTALASLITGIALPVPPGLAGELVESLDHPMVASGSGLRDLVPDPPGGLLSVDDAIALALADRTNRRPPPVNALADPHRLADTDPGWAGGDALRIGRLARAVTPPPARPTLGLLNVIPGPIAGALRTGLDTLVTLTPKVRPA